MPYNPQYPPDIKEIIAPPNFDIDLDMQERIIEDKMITSYVTVMFICSLVLCAVILI